MKVIHVFNTMNSGGLQRVVLMLSDWLDQRGVSSVLLAAGGPMVDRVGEKTRFVEKTRFGFPGDVVQLFRLARRERPDVLHAHQRKDALTSAIVGRLLGIPVVEHAHNILPNMGPKSLSFRSARIFAVSDQVAEMVTDVYGAPADRVMVVGGTPANVIDEPAFDRPAPDDRPLLVLAIGRVAEQKDPLRFVRIISAASRRADISGRWLGSGPLRDDALAEVARLGAPVVFAGESDDIAHELDKADALMITSKWEGLGLVVLEAFARRRPVVGSATGGLVSLLGDGKGTPVHPEATDEEFADALVAALTSGEQSEQIVEKAYRYVSEEASPDSVFGPVLAAYDELAPTATRAGR